MPAGKAWSEKEVEAAVLAYREMLRKELVGTAYNKAENNRDLLQHLDQRPRTAVEKKHQNISAILHEAGMPSIAGYKPLGNWQELLRTIVYKRIVKDPKIRALAGGIVERSRFQKEAVPDLVGHEVDPPDMSVRRAKKPRKVQANDPPKLPSRDYLAEEARNRSLGLAGERFVLEVERRRLVQAGQLKLARKVRHVSVEEGDYLGFDILSFSETGEERFIEVKTTQFGQFTPFFASLNEVEVSRSNEPIYRLYRVYSFSRDTRYYRLAGALSNSCRLDPVVFRGLPL